MADVQSVTDAALAHLELEALLDVLLERIRDILGADTAAILLLDESAGELVARAAKGLEEEVERGTRIPMGGGFAGRVAAERRPIAIADVDHANVLNPLLREKGVKSLLGVPLAVQSRIIGVLHVGTLTPRDFTADDALLLQLVGDRAALGIDHARLFADERRARQEAEQGARRLADLQQVTDTALARLELDALLHELLSRVTAILGTDTAAVLLVDGDTGELAARAARGLEEEVERGFRIPIGAGFAGRVAREARPIAIDDIEKADVLNPLLREKGVKSLLGVPLVVEGEVIGVLHVGTLVPRRFDPSDSELLELVAERVAIAIDRAQLYEREHKIAETLQRSLLPQVLVDLPGIDVAARYVAPRSTADVGGDWYDAIALPDGQVGVAIGDVVGRGLRAATLMGQLRNGLRAYAVEGLEPAATAELLAHLTRETSPGATATMIYLSYAPDTGTAAVVNAGHLPPLVIGPDGAPTFLAAAPAVPLGATRHPRYEHSHIALEPGSTLVLFTDGLVERPGEDLDTSLERLCDAASGISGTADERCDALVDALVGGGGVVDDVAVLAFRVLPLDERLRERFRAQPDAAPVMRRLLDRWLRDRGVPEEIAYDTVVAAGEAAANAIEHAYGPGRDAAFELAGTVADGCLEVSIADSGGWREPRGEHRGRGLMLMDAFMDDVQVLHSSNGTTVTLRREIDGQVAA